MFIRPSSKRVSTSTTDRARADLADAVVVGEDEPELRSVLEALGDQLLVALLEDVERHLLGREEHERQREEAELASRPPERRDTPRATP